MHVDHTLKNAPLGYREKNRTLLESHKLEPQIMQGWGVDRKGHCQSVKKVSERAEGSQSGPGRGAGDDWKSEGHLPEAMHQRGLVSNAFSPCRTLTQHVHSSLALRIFTLGSHRHCLSPEPFLHLFKLKFVPIK